MNKQVDEHLGKQTSPQKAICFQLRGIIFGVFPGIGEEMKWGAPTYAKGRFYFVALKDHVNLGDSMGGLSEDEKNCFEGQNDIKLSFFIDESTVIVGNNVFPVPSNKGISRLPISERQGLCRRKRRYLFCHRLTASSLLQISR
jgi:hypothetical protein